MPSSYPSPISPSSLTNRHVIFTEKKRKIGTEEFHVVKDNENMLLISQKEAILLSSLYALNNLVPGQEPETGERLTLQYKSYETPKTNNSFKRP
ncbi:hypothetical protein EMGBS15_10050 [Filimonas sp.]|nr:hypothetical protein EMGBS15_10050 [Filimonas sp.]